MIQMKVDCPTIWRMVMVPAEAGDMVATEAVMAEDMAMVVVVAMVPAQKGVAAPLPMTAATLLKARLTCKLMVTPMMTHNSFMIT